MSEKHFRGGCQCGAVTYEVDVDVDNSVVCNCSRCQRMGFVLAFTSQDKFDLKSGEGGMTEYLFNSGRIRHRFCSTCGVESFALGTTPDGREMAAINVNCLDGIDPRSLESTPVDGAAK